MARTKDSFALPTIKSKLEAELMAVVDESSHSQKRTEEVKELVIKMILLGRKKGRPALKEKEFENAA
jgi:hypothetical protein